MKKIIADGNTAASLAAYHFSENVAIYPITPSSTMAENIDVWSSQNKKNLFGQNVKVSQLQSEAGAAGTLHGLASAGSLASTFTASQGLLLMVPNMFKIAGENLPCVIHVAARTVATHALSIFGDHSDVMSTRQTGFAMLCSSNPQQAHDMAVISHLATLESSIPFLHFFDGFRTSHELRKIEVLEDNDFKKLTNFKAIEQFKQKALNSANPTCRGTAQNPDIFFQNREANNSIYLKTPQIVQDTMDKFAKISGRQYKLFEYFGSKNPKAVAVVLGSASETLKQVAQSNNCGVLTVHLYRPFNSKAFVSAIPTSCKKIVVLDRCKEDGSVFEPLCQDVISALAEQNKSAKVIGGRFGLGGKEFTPDDADAVFKNALSKTPKNHFTVGICDDLTNLSLKTTPIKHKETSFNCKFFGLGSDGTVSANKNSLKIIGEHCGKFVQGYFEYDSKKSGSITTSHLRICDNEIASPYLVKNCDFMACHHPSFVGKFEMLNELKENGTFLLNTNLNKQELKESLPVDFKEKLAKKHIDFYIIDASALAEKIGLKGKINLIMQSAFFKLIKIIDFDNAKQLMKEFAKKTYSKKGEAVLKANFDAIDLAEQYLEKIEITKDFIESEKIKANIDFKDSYFQNFIKPIIKLNGNDLPVSAFKPNGEVPTNTTKFEKRGICNNIPNWNSEKCVECGLCSFVCPHSCIRPVLVKKGTKKPKGFVCKDAIGFPGFEYRIQVSALDCTGCSHCSQICPTKAISMSPVEDIVEKEVENYNFSLKQTMPEQTKKLPLNVKSTQFKKPLFEFCGACSGCGETPYIKILTQLFGDHLIIANATGCSSIYGGNSPTCPYAKNEENRGPAWQNSLFEDNAEFGFGLYLAYKTRREKIKFNLENLKNEVLEKDKTIITKFLKNFNSFEETKNLAPRVEQVCKNSKSNFAKEILLEKEALVKQTFWLIGGDGWAYDIGFGGLDHILAQNEDIKVLVLDTNVYSNTGGQASKATPLGAVAKFDEKGKDKNKKDLAQIFMTYKNIYVAQIALGANPNQTLTALNEAQNYNGSAIVIAYSTCINQGFDLSKGLAHQKEACNCGLWNLFRFNPANEKLFSLDCGDITTSLKEFCLTESRFSSLQKTNPKQSNYLLDLAEKNAKAKRDYLKNL